MSKEESSRSPGGAGAAADHQIHTDEENYPKRRRGARSRGALWFKLWSSEWLAQTRSLSVSDVGILITWLAAMHEAGAPLEDDESRLARLCGCRTNAIRKAREVLIEAGLIIKTRRGLWSPLMQEQIENEINKSKLAQQSASQRWGKSQQNHLSDDAIAYKEEDIEEDASGDGLQPSPSAGKSSDAVLYDPLRDGLKSHPRAVENRVIRVGESFYSETQQSDVLVLATDVDRHRIRVRVIQTGQIGWALAQPGDVLERAPPEVTVEDDDECPFTPGVTR